MTPPLHLCRDISALVRAANFLSARAGTGLSAAETRAVLLLVAEVQESLAEIQRDQQQPLSVAAIRRDGGPVAWQPRVIVGGRGRC